LLPIVVTLFSDSSTFTAFFEILEDPMSNDIDNVEEIDNKFQHAFESDSASHSNNDGDSTALKNKFKANSSSRKRLEQRLEDSRIYRQVREFDFDDIDE
jgi:hypothetical protein